MWERTLQDLIRGLRANKKDESKFIAKAVDEIRQEIKTDDMDLKAGAVLKLTYLDMLGYNMNWASFHVVEVMSSPRIHLKSVGYLAAAQSFEQDTDVLMLTTNLLKKDMSSTPADIAVTLNGLAHIVTPDLARDVAPELIAMLNHSREHIRKRAILALYKVLMKYPEAMPQARARLEENLEDADPSVIAATVNVLCELARRNPTDYLNLAPQLFHLLTTSSNNWMLIKIIKLFGCLSPYEPRLVKKLQPPITELISTTPAISLLYECVHTCIIGGMLRGSSGDNLAKLCVSKLATFIEDPDQNLKYIALLAMAKIVPTHPYLVAEYQETILASLNDQDISIRMRALDLISAMVNRSNIQSIVQQLLSHLVPTSSLPPASQALAQLSAGAPVNNPTSSVSSKQSPAYRLVLAQHILEICSRSTYENITNFEWYLSVLVDLAHVARVDIGAEIRDQLVDVVGRVRGVRRFAVKVMYTLLSDETMHQSSQDEGNCSEVLWAAAWICGEYCSELVEPQKLLSYVLQPEISTLAPDIIAVFLHAAVKVLGFWTSELAQCWDDDDLPEIKDAVETFMSRASELSRSPHIEVQERAANALQLLTLLSADLSAYRSRPAASSGFATVASSSLPSASSTITPPFPKSLYLIHPLHTAYELNPVSVNAQASVPVPDGLDLDAWIVPPPEEPPRDDEGLADKIKKGKKGKGKARTEGKAKVSKQKAKAESIQELLVPIEGEEVTPEERERRKAERRAQLRDDPYYIIDDEPSEPVVNDIDNIPVVRLMGMPALPQDPSAVDRFPVLRAASQTFSSEQYVIEKEGEMPEGVTPPPSLQRPISVSALRPLLSVQHGIVAPEPRPPQSTIRIPPANGTPAATPEPIKVVRSKKKTGKKTRTSPQPKPPSD